MEKESSTVRFVTEVRRAFAFLVEDYTFQLAGMQVAPQNARALTYVRYETSTIFVMPHYDRYSGEMDLSIGRNASSMGAQERAFGINDLIALYHQQDLPSGLDRINLVARHGQGPQSPYFTYTAYEAERVSKGVMLLAAKLQQYGTRALNNNLAFFDELDQERTRRSRKWAHKLMVSQIRRQAETAWGQREYTRVALLYAQIIDDLSALERKKWEYARKKCQQ